MRNVTHELVGVSLAVAASRVLKAGPVETVAVAAAAFHGSWLPDADQLGARVHRRSRLERRSLVAGVLGALARLPLVAFALISRHRGITHSLAACLLLAGLAAAATAALGSFAAAVAGGLALGYVGHVAADACTPSGVELWRPFSSRAVWLVPAVARVRTGSAREILVAVGALALAAGALA
jgi:membrane-bound metal-dependent hydrolase YbcI (DUF457 family)